MSNLARAIEIAASAHREQKRKDGSPYVLHPLRLMFKVSGETEMMAAVLHDVVEDTGWTLKELKAEGFSDELMEVIDLLTHRVDLTYDAYIERLSTNSIARAVKKADLEDNMNIKALPELTKKDLSRIEKYHRFYRKLKEAR